MTAFTYQKIYVCTWQLSTSASDCFPEKENLCYRLSPTNHQFIYHHSERSAEYIHSCTLVVIMLYNDDLEWKCMLKGGGDTEKPLLLAHAFRIRKSLHSWSPSRYNGLFILMTFEVVSYWIHPCVRIILLLLSLIISDWIFQPSGFRWPQILSVFHGEMWLNLHNDVFSRKT